jgi:hypothetical protein
MEVLLLSGYRPAQPIGLESDSTGELLLNHRIRELKGLGLRPVVVLAGPHADDHLRKARELDSCELVFDVNHLDANFFSNFRSGLRAVEHASFALPIEVPVPPRHVWTALKMELLHEGFQTENHILQFATSEGAPWHYGFPFLTTAVGRKVILDLETPVAMTDARIRYHFLPAPLAPETV